MHESFRPLHRLRRLALIALVALALPVVLPSAAHAQYREFTGKVQKIKKGAKGDMIVDNRMGDKLSFVRAEDATVEGEKTSWDDIKKDDWVTVSWKIIDKPRKAYKIVVLPPREEPGEEE